MNNLGYPTHNLVKTLDIEIDEEYIYSDVALSRLSRAPYNGCAFPLVRRIVLLLVTNGCLTEGMKTESNTVVFVQRIKEMAPNVNDIWVRPLDCDAPRYNTSHIYGRLVTLFFPLVGHIQYSRAVMPMMPAALLSSIACNLVHIKCTVVNNDKNFIKLAQHSLTTLESLVIDSKRCINTPSIIWKEDGDFVTYPHLHTFKLSGPSIGDEMSQPVPTGVVPFPSLRCLKIDYEYTFGDDAVFKGNAATLESLDLYLGDSAISVLCQYNVFTPTSHPKLRYVRTWNPSDRVPCVFATNVEAIKFVMGIDLTASRRGIGGYQNGAKIIPTLSQLDGLASIQVLSGCH
ncbi:hypothetical protein GGH93_004952 [Coemansia aciculifera]|nr:hypothetical protein GGH93_004952 [Coemansia aciculifera]